MTPRLSLLSLVVLLSTGCAQLLPAPKVDLVELPPRTPMPVVAPVQGPPSGGLFSPASFRPPLEDRRARLVGDTVTVNIIENISASQKSTSNIGRTSEASAGITALPFLKAPLLGKLDVGATTKNAFEGKGGTESTNTFTGSITTTVVEVQPNGHLVIVGEKQVGVNQNVDVLRFSGTVDPRNIQSGSVVSSTQVANARIQSRGRGAQDEAQTIGWLSRFFFSVSPF